MEMMDFFPASIHWWKFCHWFGIFYQIPSVFHQNWWNPSVSIHFHQKVDGNDRNWWKLQGRASFVIDSITYVSISQVLDIALHATSHVGWSLIVPQGSLIIRSIWPILSNSFKSFASRSIPSHSSVKYGSRWPNSWCNVVYYPRHIYWSIIIGLLLLVSEIWI